MDPTFLSAVQLAGLVKSGKAGCLELLDHFIARTERLDGRINAMPVRDFDRARARARAMDNQADKTAPLFGVPMTVKESFDVAGLPSTRGHLANKAVPVTVSSLAVRRLEAAGAIIFGKTNVPVDLADWQSFNPVYGTTSNPWDTTRTPGGSSGGSAAVMAAGLSGLELGTDIGGSVRVPAHYCGVYGHKPTWAIAPNYASAERSLAGGMDIASLGPIARSAEDLAVVMGLLGQPDPDQTGLRIVLPEPRATGLKGLRVALWPNQDGQATDSETVAALEALGDFLEREGAVVSRTARPALDPLVAYHLYLRLLAHAWSTTASDAVVAKLKQDLAQRAADDMSADAIMLRETDTSHRAWLALNEARWRTIRVWSAFFRDWDVLLCPVISSAAIPHQQTGQTWERRITIDGHAMAYNDMLFWPGLITGSYLPATIAPVGHTRAGLPLGVQIAGPLHGDRTTLAVAAMLEQAYRGFRPPVGW